MCLPMPPSWPEAKFFNVLRLFSGPSYIFIKVPCVVEKNGFFCTCQGKFVDNFVQLSCILLDIMSSYPTNY